MSNQRDGSGIIIHDLDRWCGYVLFSPFFFGSTATKKITELRLSQQLAMFFLPSSYFQMSLYQKQYTLQ